MKRDGYKNRATEAVVLRSHRLVEVEELSTVTRVVGFHPWVEVKMLLSLPGCRRRPIVKRRRNLKPLLHLQNLSQKVIDVN